MADTSTVGGVMSGYCATGKLPRASRPASTTKIDSTDAKIGRLMKNVVNTVPLRYRLSLAPFRGLSPQGCRPAVYGGWAGQPSHGFQPRLRGFSVFGFSHRRAAEAEHREAP